jgi:5-methylcytosine-specific restriction endonuclease McrA
VYELLESNEVNLSTIFQVSRILSPENKDRVLARIRGTSQREVEAVVAEYEPRAAIPPDRVRTVVISVATPAPVKDKEERNAASPDGRTDESHNRSGCGREDPAGAGHNRSGCASKAPAGQAAGAESVAGTAKLERRALVQFSASEAFMAKVERVRSLAWYRLPANASFEQVFELALDLVIEREDPRMRSERREARGRSARARETMAATAPISQKPCRQTDATHRARFIPAPVRDQVFTRDKGRCTYTGSNGRRCASTRALQIDHIKPAARGGAGTSDNLRLLCAYHNRLEAERLMGCQGVRDGPPSH